MTFRQIFWQGWYRIKSRFVSISWYTSYNSNELFNVALIHGKPVPESSKYLGNNTFKFIGLVHQFENGIDWNFNGYGKLWNYNLQYFDYLLDNSIPVAERQAMLLDFSERLVAGSVKLEPYPVSLRIVNTIIFISANNISNDTIESALKRQISYLTHNLEYHILANHLLENIIALFFSAYALRERRLLERSARLLEQELNKQVLDDGGHYECSPMYHSIILSGVLSCIDLVRSNPQWGKDIPFLALKASVMIGWLQQISFQGISWALVNDAAPGIAPAPTDLFFASERLGIVPDTKPLHASGYRKLNGKSIELLIDTGGIIPSYQPGHAHADMLHFCMQAGGAPFFVDTGVSTYENNTRRHLERSTSSHNTVTVNGDNQSEVWSSFRVGRRAAIFVETDLPTEVTAFHTGYKKRHKVVHKRGFSVTDDDEVVITDTLLTKDDNRRRGIASFHLDGAVSIREQSESRIKFSNGFEIRFFGSSEVSIQSYRQAVGFNWLVDAKKIKVEFSGTLVSKISTT